MLTISITLHRPFPNTCFEKWIAVENKVEKQEKKHQCDLRQDEGEARGYIITYILLREAIARAYT